MKRKTETRDTNTHFNLYTKPLLNKVTEIGWFPECKEDVVDLLTEVQIGYVSCRKAADILFPILSRTPANFLRGRRWTREEGEELINIIKCGIK